MSHAIIFPSTLKGQLLRLYNSLVSPIQKRYYIGIAIQTDFDYMRSERFQMRYQVLGLDHAISAFRDDPKEREYFFNETRRHTSLIIRLAHLRDAILNRTPHAYDIG